MLPTPSANQSMESLVSDFTDSNPSSPSKPARSPPHESHLPPPPLHFQNNNLQNNNNNHNNNNSQYSLPRPGIYSSSQINPNSSSTNLFKLTPLIGKNANDSTSSLPMYHPYPNKRINLSSFQVNSSTSLHLPLTPPLSKPSSPVRLPLSTTSSNSTAALYNKFINCLPPIDVKISILCTLWYLTSIISSNSTKAILTQFEYPITLTEFQFSLNATFCVVLLFILNLNPSLVKVFPYGIIPTNLSIAKFLYPTPKIISTTLPMGGFQFIGHLTSHKATSLIPVSLVHTIKSLSPLITVFIYKALFAVNYKIITYITLIPLTIGIMLTCYKPSKGNSSSSASASPYYLTGLFFAFISMLIFVSQNIFAKNRLTIKENDSLPNYKDKKSDDFRPLNDIQNNNNNIKLDKLSILFYCSVIGFLLTLPVYIISELFNNDKISIFNLSNSVLVLVILNGFSHFLQSLLAFQLLGMLSPVNYSIANILKRIFIILISFIWENKLNSAKFSGLQQFGLGLTLFGLYCYDRWGTTSQH